MDQGERDREREVGKVKLEDVSSLPRDVRLLESPKPEVWTVSQRFLEVSQSHMIT